VAVARAGSGLRAGQALGVNQTTVMRRLMHIERALGAELFERKPSGYVLTTVGQRVAATAGRIEEEVKTLGSALRAEQRAISGCVRVTASELMVNALVTPLLREFRKQYPGVLLELIADDRRLDLARGEADVALRASSRPEGAGIVARRLPDIAWSVYCSRSYAEEHGAPDTIDALESHAVIAVEGGLASLPGPRLLARVAPSSKIGARSNSLTNLILALKAGLGIATLPCFAGDAHDDLVRCLPPIPELVAEQWLVVREEVKSAPHVRAFVDFLAEYIQGLRAPLSAERKD
jgi:DNA-binding transcriptional LysR family regulator